MRPPEIAGAPSRKRSSSIEFQFMLNRAARRKLRKSRGVGGIEEEQQRFAAFWERQSRRRPELMWTALKYEQCTWSKPCWGGGCPRCGWMVQQWVKEDVLRLLETIQFLGPLSVMSWVLPGQEAFGEIGVIAWQRAMRRALRMAGVTFAIGGLDFSWNEDRRKSVPSAERFKAHWSVQVWVIGRSDELRLASGILKERFPATSVTPRPVMVRRWDGRPEAIAYALKPTFVRRQTYDGFRNNEERSPCRRIRNRKLTTEQTIELAQTLRGADMMTRLIVIGAQVRETREGWQFRLRRRADALRCESV